MIWNLQHGYVLSGSYSTVTYYLEITVSLRIAWKLLLCYVLSGNYSQITYCLEIIVRLRIIWNIKYTQVTFIWKIQSGYVLSGNYSTVTYYLEITVRLPIFWKIKYSQVMFIWKIQSGYVLFRNYHQVTYNLATNLGLRGFFSVSLICGPCFQNSDCAGTNQVCTNGSCQCDTNFFLDNSSVCQPSMFIRMSKFSMNTNRFRTFNFRISFIYL